MSQTQEEKSARLATARAEELIDRMERGLGFFVGSTSQRIQNTATTVREKANQRGQSKTTHGEKASQSTPAPRGADESSQLAMEKADELVGRIEQRIDHFTSLMSLRVQKAAARMREEAEDMWAEAQHLRHQNRRKLQ